MSFRTNRRTRRRFRVGRAEERDEQEYMMYPEEKEDREYDFIDDEYPKDRIGDI